MIDYTKHAILAVDDEADNLLVFKATLELMHGAKVHIAFSTEGALAALAAFKPTMIVTDLSMPNADGYVLLHQLRKRQDTAKLPIIALTAHAMKGDRDRIMAAGFDGYISKPFDVATIADDLAVFVEAHTAKLAADPNYTPSVLETAEMRNVVLGTAEIENVLDTPAENVADAATEKVVSENPPDVVVPAPENVSGEEAHAAQ